MRLSNTMAAGTVNKYTAAGINILNSFTIINYAVKYSF